MKYLDRFISFIFALVILILAITVILVNFDCVTEDSIFSILHEYVFEEGVSQISLIVAIVVVVLALKVTIFNSNFKSKDKAPIMVETNNGLVEISQDTIDNTVRGVASEFSEIKEVQAKMFKKKKGIDIYTAISVLSNTNIRQLTSDFQERIGQVIDETTGIKVLSTNIKVKNIYDKSKKNNKVDDTENTKKVEPVKKIAENKKVEVTENSVEEVVEDVKEEVSAEVKEQNNDNSSEVKE